MGNANDHLLLCNLAMWSLSLAIDRAWESLSTVTCCRSLVVVYDGMCVLQIGVAALSSSNEGDAMSVDTTKLVQGSLYQGVITSSSRKKTL